jgi:hypothetical protein
MQNNFHFLTYVPDFSLFGLGISILFFKITLRDFTSHLALDKGAIIFLILLAAVACFCITVGFRLSFNRPNHYGSILPPFGWMLLIAIFFFFGVMFTYYLFSRAFDRQFLKGAIYSYVFLLLCWKAYSDVRKRIQT